MLGKSGGLGARGPIVVEAVGESRAAESDDGVGTADSPEHTGEFASLSDVRQAASITPEPTNSFWWRKCG